MLLLYKGSPPDFWRYIIVFLLSLLLAQGMQAQDILSSQWLPMKAQLHPALTGPGQDNYEAGINHRQQWVNVANGYHTSLAFIHKQHANLGWGAKVWQQAAGTRGWQDNGLALQLAYHQKVNQYNQRLSVGLSVGARQRRLRDIHTYDQQYVAGNGFDSSLDNGEVGLLANRSILDWSAGFAWRGGKGRGGKERWLLGLTAAHLHQPDFSLSEITTILAARWSATAAVPIPLREKTFLMPVVHVQKQGGQREFRFGAQLYQTITPTLEAWLGGQIRYGDASVWQMGIHSEKVRVWLSYDWNSSTLNEATQGKGAFELGMSYRWQKSGKGKWKEYNRLEEPLDRPVVSTNILPKDSDQDGVPDDLDQCPLVYGLSVYSGCNDQDRDGIIDPNDSCPEIFGYPDQNGCPFTSKDSDQDGVPDEADYCIYIKGEARFHGCPDTDQDGVSDIDDNCPFLRGSASNGGCPSAETEKKDEQLNIPPLVVYFDKDESKISISDQQLLINAIQIWPRKSPLKLLITGHTDTEGNEAYNYALGRRRADAIWAFLSQLVPENTEANVISFGEMLPVNTDKSVTNRDAANRRVEIRIVSFWE